MGSSFVLFDVSMEITQGQFRFGESGYTQKRPCPWANAIYPWVKWPVKPRLMSASQSPDLLLSLTLIHVSNAIFYSFSFNKFQKQQ